MRRVTRAYDEYEVHIVFHSIHNFCTIELSNIYFDILKDRLYCSKPDDPERRAAQTVLYQLINSLVVMLTPILAFTTEEIWSYLRREGQPESVQLLEWPMPDDKYLDDDLEKRMDKVLSAREWSQGPEEARAKKVTGILGRLSPHASPDWEQVFNGMDQIEDVYRIQLPGSACGSPVYKAVSLEHVPGLAVEVACSGRKCERCWVIDPPWGPQA